MTVDLRDVVAQNILFGELRCVAKFGREEDSYSEKLMDSGMDIMKVNQLKMLCISPLYLRKVLLLQLLCYVLNNFWELMSLLTIFCAALNVGHCHVSFAMM